MPRTALTAPAALELGFPRSSLDGGVSHGCEVGREYAVETQEMPRPVIWANRIAQCYPFCVRG